MTIAEQVKETIEAQCPGTFSLYAGYGMAAGKYVRWPAGVQEKDTRNDKGQCSMARYRYADNSTLTYRREPDNNYVLIAKE